MVMPDGYTQWHQLQKLNLMAVPSLLMLDEQGWGVNEWQAFCSIHCFIGRFCLIIDPATSGDQLNSIEDLFLRTCPSRYLLYKHVHWKIETFSLSRNSRKLVLAKYFENYCLAKFANICSREIFRIRAIREIRENKFPRNFSKCHSRK